ncbi:bd9c0cdc-73b9-4e44-b1dc-d01c46b986d7 [Thermothielavioides terrestris]|uniref:Bd9c0cdc-73b9-4e44-b1dc-d01c46b986d7 n=1 Tax=Thermothielavioides terrestris TaxID=2587410 RepID=A0A446BHE2_9PEZI|nr:bd9c0cdc-73b9-4e44-b1dc-d01c46b986d7 [Thermothielavioides terrestris]
MPPKRRRPAAGASSSAAASTSKATAARPSKLAKEHNLTAEEEAEIREAFSLFAEPMEGEKEGVIPIGDVRRALIALGIPASSPAQLATFTATLDPDDEGFATYSAFLGICALQLQARRQHDDDNEAHQAELDEAYALFAGGDADAPAITLEHLKRVAALLRLDQPAHGGSGAGGGGGNKKEGDGLVTEEVLRDMILEANGGAGVGKGVAKDEFDRVMRRAGVWR